MAARLETMDNIPTQAAQWLVRLSSEDPPPSREDQIAFESWKNADPRHRDAVAKIESLMGTLQALPATATAAALQSAQNDTSSDRASWSSLAKTLCLLIAVLLPLWLIYPKPQLAGWLADMRTTTGEWQSYTLSDNSRIILSSNSAIDMVFTEQQRKIELVHGEILVDVAKDHQRPFVVETPQGSFTALGTRFTVQSRDQDSSILTVTESSVRARSALNTDPEPVAGIVVKTGQRLKLRNDGYTHIESIEATSYEHAWRSRQLVAHGQPLVQVLAQLKPYYKGYLHYNTDELAQLRVYAVLPLDQPQHALQLLSESFPIQVETFTPWLTKVSKK